MLYDSILRRGEGHGNDQAVLHGLAPKYSLLPCLTV